MDQMTMTLMRDNACLVAEVRKLRSLVGYRRRGSVTVADARADALSLIQQRFIGHPTGRVEMGRQGMSKRRWAWAVAYLRFAGVVAYRTGEWRRGLRWVAMGDDALRLMAEAKPTYKQLQVIKREV
jgi:hypothetical protein